MCEAKTYQNVKQTKHPSLSQSGNAIPLAINTTDKQKHVTQNEVSFVSTLQVVSVPQELQPEEVP